jgi:ABC-2 type transport system permease protein
VSSFANVALGVAGRNLKHAFKNPALLVPSILFPLIFLVAFAGGLSSVGDVPDFGFRSGYTSFQFVFVFLQSAAFGGVFTGLGIATDFESGFARRLLLAAPRRTGILAGYVLAGLGRFAFTTVIVTLAGVVAGMEVDGTAPQFLGLIGLAFLLNVASTLFAAGVSLRMQTIQAGPLMQIPIFLGLFLAPVYVPLELLDGWIHAVAEWNPLTALVEAGRGLISGVPDNTLLALAVVLGLIAVTLAWALRSLRRAESLG